MSDLLAALTVDYNVSALTVFLQGLISFFSPCVLPLMPLYMGYLAGGTYKRTEEGTITYPRKRVFLNTLFFALGITFAFFLLGIGVTAIRHFFANARHWFTLMGGILILLFGLYQLGVFGTSQTMSRERRLPISMDKLAMNPLTALLMGFGFSFAWTPCVGPTLTSVLLMAAGSESRGFGYLLIALYALGFVIPLLLIGLFTTTVLTFFKSNPKVMRYSVIIGGIIMVVIGIRMIWRTLPQCVGSTGFG